MTATAKVFSTGNSQAVRLPKAFRVSVQEMWIAKNEVTGEIALRPKDEDQRRKNLDELLKLIGELPFTEDFIPSRDT
jgi:antitoxin VapB